MFSVSPSFRTRVSLLDSLLAQIEAAVAIITGRLTFGKVLEWLCLAAACLTSCSRTAPIGEPHLAKPAGARLEVAEALELARSAAISRGENLKDYELKQFNYFRKSGTWDVYFHGVEAIPGNHFSIEVDDATGKTRFLGGK